MRFTFTQKVVTAILSMILLLMGGVLVLFDWRTRSIADGEVTRRLYQTDTAFDNYIEATAEKLRTVNAYISGNSFFKAYMAEAIENGDTDSLLDQYEEIRGFSKCEFMIVLDGDGEPVAEYPGGDNGEPLIAIESLDTLGAFIETLNNRLYAGYDDEVSDGLNENGGPPPEEAQPAEEDDALIGSLASQGRLYNVVTSPITDDEYLHGYVVVGYSVDDKQAEKIGRITNCDLIILSGKGMEQSRVVARYFEGEGSEYADSELIEALSGGMDEEVFDFNVKGSHYKGLISPIKSVGNRVVGRQVTIKSMMAEKAPFRSIQSGMVLIGFLALLIVSPLSVVAARGVTRPVNHLVGAIEKVREGEYDEKRIQVKSKDEIGLMAGAFKAMVRELREQQELIEFLERSSQDRQVDPDRTQAVIHDRETLHTGAVRQAMSDDDHLPAGFLLAGRYEIKGVLGQGGMGVVYQAKDNTLDEIVAIKMLHLERTENADMLKRETKLARKVTHRNILRIYDLGELQEIQFISMEYVNGITVKKLLERTGQLPLGIGLRIARQVCMGLSAAHAAGIVHGDIKPENVIINKRGEIKIMDFGVARIAAVETGQGGMVSGTPRYMPPEQFQGRGIDSRSDIYSLGIMLFELFAGRPPFTARTLPELFTHHLSRELPPLKELNPKAPTRLAEIIVRAASKRQEDRYASAREMLAALKTI